MVHFTWLMPPGPYRATTCGEKELTLDHIHTFLTTQVHGGPLRMRDMLNAGASSETTLTWNTIHSIHAPIHCNQANMKGWLWRPNDIWVPCEPKASWHFLAGEEKLRKKLHSGNLSRPGIEPEPAAWQTHMLPPDPQRCTRYLFN